MMTPAPPRRWFRWSLRTMFVVMTICGVIAGCYAAFPLASLVGTIVAVPIGAGIALYSWAIASAAYTNLLDIARAKDAATADGAARSRSTH